MTLLRNSIFLGVAVFAATCLHAKVSESSVENQLKALRSLSAEKRPAATLKAAQELVTLPAGPEKVKLADTLAGLSTEGDSDVETLQAVVDALSKSLAESPSSAKGDQTPRPYMDLARLVRYEGLKTTLDDPQYLKAKQTLLANESDIAKADFTLKDLHGKKYTLSELHGKIVMVNFWATWCGPCKIEMPDLDAIYKYFEPQGLVVLSITAENAFKVNSFISSWGYRPPVLIDPEGAVHKQFHIEGVPNSFLFNRDGKLVAVAIDRRTRRQFLQMLSKTDLHP